MKNVRNWCLGLSQWACLDPEQIVHGGDDDVDRCVVSSLSPQVVLDVCGENFSLQFLQK